MLYRRRVLTAAVVAGTVSYAARQTIRGQAAWARRIIGKPLGEVAWDADRTYRKRSPGRIELLVLGDSVAAGLGAERPKHTLGARLARKLARATDRSVRLTTGARVGAEASDLDDQLNALPSAYRPDVAVVIVGGNDVIHGVPHGRSVRHLGDCVLRLRAVGAEVVVGTCPDLGALRPVPQPLRSLGARSSRRLAASQRRIAVRQGARVVELAQALGPMFVAHPDEMFSLDRFHPSSAGYKRTAAVILPALLDAVAAHDRAVNGHPPGPGTAPNQPADRRDVANRPGISNRQGISNRPVVANRPDPPDRPE